MINVENLHLNIDGREILRGIELHLQPGDIYGLLGPNGAGKSTTIFALLGLRARSRGLISVLGQDPAENGLELRRSVGVIPEQAGFYDWMTASMYLRLFARFYERWPSDRELQELLRKVGLDWTNRPIGSYSRGMKQRLAMARALIHQPRLLILDEPTNGLDPKGRREIHDLLLDFTADRKAGVLLCTHLLDDVDRLCNRIGIVDQGRTRLEGRPGELLADNGAERQYSLRLEGTPDDLKLPDGVSMSIDEGGWRRIRFSACVSGGPAAVWEELWRRGWRILEIRSQASNLEELYMNTIGQDDGEREAA